VPVRPAMPNPASTTRHTPVMELAASLQR
jgi:hypothetical protein